MTRPIAYERHAGWQPLPELWVLSTYDSFFYIFIYIFFSPGNGARIHRCHYPSAHVCLLPRRQDCILKVLDGLFFLITRDFRSSDHSHWPWLKVSVKALLPGVLWDSPTKGIFPQSGKTSFIFILRCGISPWNLPLVCQHWGRDIDLIYITNGLLLTRGS